MKTPTILITTVAALGVLAGGARAQSTAGGGITADIGFDQNLGAQAPIDLTFRDEKGRGVRLSDYLGRRPAVLVLGYYRCPLLCNQVLNGVTRTLRAIPQAAGTDFDVIAVSIDPKEQPELAGAKKATYVEEYGRGSPDGWHFLVGDEGPIGELARAVGFRYKFNAASGLYAHAAGFVVLTPDGRVARYFYGIDYQPKELSGAISAASRGGIGSPIRALLMLCYDYDSATGKYTLSIVRISRVLGTATALSLGLYMFIMIRRERRGGSAARVAAEPSP
ncbi:SCO family protein [Aquisphaera insulae]|uniref:SCO family protein n=1 Tax=Aquisphaera insulae TaxID=2712864 RepID=UPI0013EB38B3|nr:SCO family protein [Aquisphaera insulae]